MNIGVIGTGYVGLVSGTCFAEMGNNVICVDIDQAKVDKLRSGQVTIFEPGLEEYFRRNIQLKRLTFTTQLEDGFAQSEILFLALPTPPQEDGSADLSYVLSVVKGLAVLFKENPDAYRIIVNKSTVPVGTGARVRAALLEAGVRSEQFDVVSNPEFLREGMAVNDFMKPERVVIGAQSERAARDMRKLYEPFVRQGNPILVMDVRSAEMTKYAANAFLATKITFMNEVANLCDLVGANVDNVRRGIGTDSRIGNQFLYPGIGFGGSCFPKDVNALLRTSRAHGYPFELLDAVLRVNGSQRVRMGEQIVAHFGGSLEGKRIAAWGLAFKANTDDVRESPAHSVIRVLLDAGATVVAYDPAAADTTRDVLGDDIDYAESQYAALEGADALVILTEWNAFRRPEFDTVRDRLRAPVIFDGRNLYDPEAVEAAGFTYFSVGRPGTDHEGQ